MINEFDEKPIASLLMLTSTVEKFEQTYRHRDTNRIRSDLLSTVDAVAVSVVASRFGSGSRDLALRTEFLADDGEWHHLDDLDPSADSILLPHWRVRLVVEMAGATDSLDYLHTQTYTVTRRIK